MNKSLRATIFLLAAVLALSCAGCARGNGNAKLPAASRGVQPSDYQSVSATQGAAVSAKKAGGEHSAVTVFGTANVGIGDNLPISRALVAKMLALAYYDQSAIDVMDRSLPFTDTNDGLWYDKYINAAYAHGIIKGGSDGLYRPEDSLTLQEAQYLLDAMNPGNTTKMKITDDNKDKAISYALWMELYEKAAKQEDTSEYGIVKKAIIPLATAGNNPNLHEWNVITDEGPLTCVGLNMDAYIDRQISVLKKGNEIVGVLAMLDTQPTIRNAYVVHSDAESITVFSGGVERKYAYANTMKDQRGLICDIQVDGGAVLQYQAFSEIQTGVIKQTTEQNVELQGAGVFVLGDTPKYYSIADKVNGATVVKWKKYTDLVVGTSIADFIMKDGKVCAAIIRERAEPHTLRVAVSTTDYKSLIHTAVQVTSQGPFTVTAGDKTLSFKAGETFTVAKDENANLFGQTRIYVQPQSKGGKLQITSIKRNWPGNESPQYRGVLEISTETGGYAVVNEVSMEDYLYAVVPSEIPSGYGTEVSKVQAVTARSYAYNQFYANRFHAYGANVDDSVSCQVYNNIPENETSIAAVDGTKGQCLTYNGQVISANFFSTSAGMTANSGEVWADSVTKVFPSDTQPYLRAAKQYTSGDFGDLRNESNAETFFGTTNLDSYDKTFSWFRWNVNMTLAELTASINANIGARYEANPPLIKTLDSGNVYRSRPISAIGNLQDIEVVERGEGGNIMKLKLTGDKATVLVMTEYNVRALLQPKKYLDGGRDIVLHRFDDTTVTNYGLMPSAFFAMKRETDDTGKLTAVTFFGGGNGHGAGMSQNGVKGMIDAGYGFADILQHYYAGTEIERKI